MQTGASVQTPVLTQITSLRRNYFVLILIEESLATADAASIDLIYQNAGNALVLELNPRSPAPCAPPFSGESQSPERSAVTGESHNTYASIRLL
jgi:hypothetical protein